MSFTRRNIYQKVFIVMLFTIMLLIVDKNIFAIQKNQIQDSTQLTKNKIIEETSLIEFHAFDAIKISIKPKFLHKSVLLVFSLIFVIISIFSVILIRTLIRRRRSIKIQQIIEDRTQILNQERKRLQKQTDTLKETNFEVKSQNKELRTESQQLKEINEMILEKNKKIEDQSKKIHQKNELLTQSLNYARRIQHSLFPELNDIKKILPKSSIFFQPKEIVSGDFYWMHAYEDIIVVAEVDCTGHGVPGAFMSMIGNTLLNEIVINKRILTPREILTKLNQDLLFIFSHDDFDDEAQDEGMDLTIAVINNKTKQIEIASAMQNFFVIKNKEVNVYRGDIFSIGGLISRLKKPVYTSQIFDITDGLRIILTSDGFVDQFGGSEKDKYGVDRFYKLLSETTDETIEIQINKIKETFDNWKGNQDQMDDVLILGFEF